MQRIGGAFMASAPLEKAGAAQPGSLLFACVAEHGSASHPYLGSDELLRGPFASRNLADFVHLLCALHGRYPGVIDHAANRSVDPVSRSWFTQAIDGFAVERAFLARLAVAAGPLPSTPGASDNDAVLRAQRHAIVMLAQSERDGCALGAALALAIDWSAIRSVLVAAATRFGLEPPEYRLDEGDLMHKLLDDHESNRPISRAMLFGAQQIALQHRGLCDLLEARQSARGIY
jgi:hypothetical protein